MAASANWKNVNNWHWVEKDYSSSAKEYISSIQLPDESYPYVFKASFEGDFIANVRKGKIILIYDYKLSVTLKDEIGEKSFDLEVDSADPDSFKHGEAVSDIPRFRPAITKVIESLNSFVEEKARSELLGGCSVNKIQSQKADLDSNTPIVSASSSSSSFTSCWIFNCPSEVLLDCLTGSLFPSWTGSKCENDEFSLHGGLISYKITRKLDSGIELLWKLRPWADYSLVKIMLTPGVSRTIIQVDQSHIDSDFASNAEDNWEKYIWRPISVSTGIGYEKHEPNA